MVSVTNHEVRACECCQPRPSTELARLRRVNRRLMANRKQLIEELKLAYRQLAEAKQELAHYERHCHCLSRHPRGQRGVVLLWDSVRRDCEAKRAAKEVA